MYAFTSTPELMFGLYLLYYFRVFERQIGSNKYSLLLSSWKRSILPGICGIVAGTLYRMNIFYVRRAQLPDFIASCFSRVSLPFMGRPSPASGTRNVLNTPYSRRQVERNYPSLMVGPVDTSEDSIAMLVSMGFGQDSAKQALVQARNDINVATNILLEAQSH